MLQRTYSSTRDNCNNGIVNEPGTTPAMSYKQVERHIYGSSRIGLDVTEKEMIGAAAPGSVEFERVLGYKQFEGTNHLGNVLVVYTDVKIPRDDNNDLTVDYFQPFVLSSQDYSPFGVLLYGRSFEFDSYRYGFNGMEKDDEVKGEGNSLNFTYRMHDSRLGRFFAVDPLAAQYPYNSPYAFSENDVIRAVELEGLEKLIANFHQMDVNYQTKIHQETSLGIEYDLNTQIITIQLDYRSVGNGEVNSQWQIDIPNKKISGPNPVERSLIDKDASAANIAKDGWVWNLYSHFFENLNDKISVGVFEADQEIKKYEEQLGIELPSLREVYGTFDKLYSDGDKRVSIWGGMGGKNEIKFVKDEEGGNQARIYSTDGSLSIMYTEGNIKENNNGEEKFRITMTYVEQSQISPSPKASDDD